MAKHKTLTFNHLNILLSILIMLSLTIIAYTPISYAKSNVIKSLSLNRTYQSYDIDNDGNSDSILVTAEIGEGDYIRKVTVKINSHSYNFDVYGTDVFAELIKLQNGSQYMYLAVPAEDAYYELCGLYRYSKGKLKEVVSFLNLADKCGAGASGTIDHVSGNDLYISEYINSNTLGPMYLKYRYSYKRSGSLYRKSKIAYNFKIATYKMAQNGDLSGFAWATKKNHKKLTLGKKVLLYKKSSSKKPSLVLKKGEKVIVKNIMLKNGKMYLKLYSTKIRKSGWFKCYTRYPKDNLPLFKECQFAG